MSKELVAIVGGHGWPMVACGVCVCGVGHSAVRLSAMQSRNTSSQVGGRFETTQTVCRPAPAKCCSAGSCVDKSGQVAECTEALDLVVDVHWTGRDLGMFCHCFCSGRPQRHLSSSCHTSWSRRSIAKGWWVSSEVIVMLTCSIFLRVRFFELYSADGRVKHSEIGYSPDSFQMNYGTFVPRNFRSQERKFHGLNFRSLELSFLGTFVPWNFRPQ